MVTYLTKDKQKLVRYLIKYVKNTMNIDGVSVITYYNVDGSLKYTYRTKKILSSLRSITDKKHYYEDQQVMLNNLRNRYYKQLKKAYNGIE